MVKLLELAERYDLVVMDAPATGHALGMMRSPKTFAAIARVGPLASRSNEVSALLSDPARSAYVAVAQGSEMTIAETLELQESLRCALDRDLDAVIVNEVLSHRFTRSEMTWLAELVASDGVLNDALPAARAAYARAQTQHSQIAHLRRQRFAHGKPPRVLTIPFDLRSEMDIKAIGGIAERLRRTL